MAADTPGVDTIFCAALEIAAEADRAAYIAQACGDDDDLRARVEKLVQAHFRAGNFLEEPAGKARPPGSVGFPFPEPSVAGALEERPGKVIGPYKLLEQIGEGGFGVVFVAEQQQPVRRRVALKVLKPGMDSRRVVARFEAERQALALMDHPNIARVFDGGTAPSGRPYFVMELVRGVPITTYADQKQLTPRERLELFVSVCQAVQHAHQKGIIHRDLKPSNVLVTLHDGTPVVKVIDFGIAKALGQQLTDKTLYTGFAQMIGTPLYMSPEQASLSGLDVDTRSDIYSLGVLLYELLTGTTPFDKKRFLEAAYDEIRRIIREEEPPRPSARLSTLGEAAAAVSAQRKSDPKRLSQFFRGELDWIVMKALDKDRGRRYETAGAFAADVGRYLQDEPVHACPPSRAYRLRKLLRRHRAAALTAAAFIGLLLAGAAVSTWLAVRAMRAEGDALAGWADAKQKENAATEARQKADEAGARAKEQERLTREALERVEDTLAENLLRPVGYSGAALTLSELGSFRDLAESPSERVRLLFLEKALARPETARRLARRSEMAVHAAVGLDRGRRDRVVGLLLRRLQEERAERDVRTACIDLGVALETKDQAFCREAAKAAVEILPQTTDFSGRSSLVQALGVLASRLPPEEAARVAAAAVPKFLDTIARSDSYDNRAFLAPELEPLTARLAPKEAAVAAQKALDAMARTTRPNTLAALAEALGPLAARRPPEDAGRLAAAGAQKLTDAIASTNEPEALVALVEALEPLAGRLPPAEASRAWAAAAQKLLDAMARSTDEDALGRLSGAMRPLPDRLRPEEAATTAQKALDTLARTSNPDAVWTLADAVGRLADRLPPGDAAKVSAAAAQKVLDSIVESRDPGGLPLSASPAMGSLAAHLPPEKAAAAAQKALDAMTRTSRPYVLAALGQALGPLAARLPPEEAGRVAATAVQKLTDAGAKADTTEAQAAQAAALVPLAAGLPPEEAGKVWAAVVPKLLDTLGRSHDPTVFVPSGNVVGALAGRLPPREAAAAAAKLLDAMAQANDADALAALAQALGQLAARLPPAEASRVAAAAAPKLTDAMAPTTDTETLSVLAQVLAQLATHLPPEQAARVAAAAAHTLLDAWARTTEAERRPGLNVALSTLAPHLSPEEAAAAAQQLLDAPARTNDRGGAYYLPQLLASLTDRLTPEAAAIAAPKLLDVMARGDDPYHSYVLAQAMPPLAARLPPAEASRVAAAAGPIILDLLPQMTNGQEDDTSLLTAVGARLTTEGLVELLKQPTCIGNRRRAVVRELSRRFGPPAPEAAAFAARTVVAPPPFALSAAAPAVHGDALYPGGRRPFADLWEAVDWLAEHHPELDLAAPPRRATP